MKTERDYMYISNLFLEKLLVTKVNIVQMIILLRLDADTTTINGNSRIPIEYIAKIKHRKESTVLANIKKLIARNIIIDLTKKGCYKQRKFTLNRNYNEWIISRGRQNG